MAGRHGWFFAACLLALCALGAAYSNHFDNGFHFDDSHVLLNNLAIRSLDNLPDFFTDANTFTSRPQNAVYRPLLTTSYAIDYRIAGGLVPRQFHRTQFALLLLLGVLLVVLYRRVLDLAQTSPWNRYVALFAATLFCIHTANTQTVNYLSARSSLVATLGVVGSLVLFLVWPRGRRTGLFLLPMLLGSLAKPLSVMFAPLLFVFVLLFEPGGSLGELSRRGGLRRLVAALRVCAPAFLLAGVLFLFLRSMEASTLDYADIDRWTYARTQPFVWLHYARLFVLPLGLTADTDWRFLESWLDARLFVGLSFLAVLCWAIARLSESRLSRPASFGLAWFGIALLPTSSIVPLSEVYNEHRIFFPYVGLALATCWFAAWGLRTLLRRSPSLATVLAAALALLVIAAHGVGTYQRNQVWRSADTLWHDVTLKSPRNGRGLMNYGLTLMRSGHLEEALEYYERAAELMPAYPVLEINLGIVKSALGNPETAEGHFRRALQLSPRYAQGHYFFAKWLKDRGRCAEAVEHLERAVEISPADVGPNHLLLQILAALGRSNEAAAHAARVLRIDPADTIARAYREGRIPEEDASVFARACAPEP